MTASPVILLGSQRSGTTALAYALNLAFNDAGGHFTVNGKLPYLLHRWLTRSDLADQHLRADEILHALDRRPAGGAGAKRWRAQTEQALRQAAHEVAEGTAGADPTALARRILTETSQDLPYWGDKYNEYLLHLPWLENVLSRPRYIMLVRHPHEAAQSMLRWTGDRPWTPKSETAALAKWTAWNSHWPAFAHQIPPERRLVIEYQALCRGDETSRLETYTGLPLSAYLTGLTPRRPCAPDDVELPQPTATLWQTLLDAARSSTHHNPTQVTT